MRWGILPRYRRRGRKRPRTNRRDGCQEPVGDAVGQRAEPHGREHEKAIFAEHLPERDEAMVLPNKAMDILAEDGPARHEGRQTAGDGG